MDELHVQDPRGGAGPDGRDREEPEAPHRGHSTQRRALTYEFVERGPSAPLAAAADVADAADVRASVAESVASDPDRELVRRWKAGDEPAFEALVRRHERRVYRLLVRMLGNPDEAEDVAQETFLNLHRHGHRFRSEARFSTFVYRVAANAALNRRRSQGRNAARMQKLAQRQAAGDHLPQGPRGPEEVAVSRETTEQVQSALGRIPPTLRLPLVLYDVEGLAYGEIARVLDIAEGTVKSRIHRARQALREELRDFVHGSTEGVPS
jgi:RNA polymerase sigma-70 factor (ECF subfamily)